MLSFFYRHIVFDILRVNQHTNGLNYTYICIMRSRKKKRRNPISFTMGTFEYYRCTFFCEHVELFCVPRLPWFSFFFFLWTDYVSKERQPSWFGFENGEFGVEAFHSKYSFPSDRILFLFVILTSIIQIIHRICTNHTDIYLQAKDHTKAIFFCRFSLFKMFYNSQFIRVSAFTHTHTHSMYIKS